MKDFVIISDYVVDINYRSINICICLLRFICVDGDAAVNMPNNNNIIIFIYFIHPIHN